jgi:dihydrolipoamide dehydrogenase
MTGAQARGLAKPGGAMLVATSEGREMSLAADTILVAIGRRPVTQGWGIEELVLDMDGAFIRIDDRCQTSMRGIYAIGDVTGEPMLAHRAMVQGEIVAEIIAGHKRVWDKQGIAAVCFTDPEIVAVGLSPDEAQKAGREVRVGLFPFTANGRAMTKQGEDGFVRVIARADNHLVLGIQAVGQGVSELAAALGLALEMGARLEDIAGTIHAHPTQGEALQEAALKALGRELHF